MKVYLFLSTEIELLLVDIAGRVDGKGACQIHRCTGKDLRVCSSAQAMKLHLGQQLESLLS